jgi:hypothetical protein
MLAHFCFPAQVRICQRAYRILVEDVGFDPQVRSLFGVDIRF